MKRAAVVLLLTTVAVTGCSGTHTTDSKPTLSASSAKSTPASASTSPTGAPAGDSIREFERVINSGSNPAMTALHARLCAHLLGTVTEVGQTYFGGQTVRTMSWTTDGVGVECAYTLDPATGTGSDEGVQKDLAVSVGTPATSDVVPHPPTDFDATVTKHGVVIQVKRSDRAQLSAQAVAEQLVNRVTT